MRGKKVVSIDYFPVRVNPQTNKLEYLTEGQISISYKTKSIFRRGRANRG